jgi:hypothetical protein
MSEKEKLFTVDPPWVEFPGSDPILGPWRQGYGEAWLLNEFLPFWRGLTPDDRVLYLEKWPAPSPEWEEYLNIHWLK